MYLYIHNFNVETDQWLFQLKQKSTVFDGKELCPGLYQDEEVCAKGPKQASPTMTQVDLGWAAAALTPAGRFPLTV